MGTMNIYFGDGEATARKIISKATPEECRCWMSPVLEGE